MWNVCLLLYYFCLLLLYLVHLVALYFMLASLVNKDEYKATKAKQDEDE